MSVYTIKKLDDNENYVYIPNPLYSIVKHSNEISFGTKTCHCIVKKSTKDKTIYICNNVWKRLMIPYTSKVHVIPNEEMIHIGPLVGVFTAGFTGSRLRPIGERSLFFAKMLSTEKTVGAFAFVFGANHINWEKGTINGYFHNSDGWIQSEIPFPNVIYDRLPNRKTENHNVLQDIKKRLQIEYSIPWFNPGFFNKLEIHQILSKHSVKQFLPETTPHPTITVVDDFLRKYNKVFIKPINGSLGLGIQQIFKSNIDNYYYCRFRQNEKNYLRKYKTLENLLTHQFQTTTLQHFIVQQGIQLLRMNEKPIDFRVHTNKDEFGEWQVSAIAAKVAGTGSITTHIGSGGTVKTMDEILNFTNLPTNIASQIEETVLSISLILDKEITGNIGEIGFDLGVDKTGKIWLFEANSKPGRSIFKHPKLKKYDKLSRSLPISYAVFLTKKSIYNPGVLFHEKT
ncbi:YheC/YheD family endospore coat-associated protein [Calidifontibacillus oryziterrae]|uniref:YheC/YheD family endospore coat-associated protein n=1 Tax=Calidifontibacillus oryziterrae TaxID=1191699 RepID=UPI0002FC60FC|nr:YheC/YheD family protein [Calidifontibacillus oryziterrae]